MEAERAALLRRFGVTEAARIGAGGEAVVYALDEARVLRVPRSGGGKAREWKAQKPSCV